MAVLRMIVRFGLALGVIVGCASSCGGIGGGDDSDPEETACEPIGGSITDGASVGGIDYQVSGGFTGGGDGTSLQIDPGGAFTRHTLQRGTEQGQLDQVTLDDLAGKARNAQFPTLCTIYDGNAADDFSYEVAVQFDASTYSVKVSEFASPPDRLQVLIEALQAIVDRPLP